MLSACCQLTLVFCFIGGGYIQLFESISSRASPMVASSVMVFASTDSVALPLVAVAIAMVALMSIIMLLLVRMEGHQPVILLTETGVPPLLTVIEGHKWHLFLSHVWSTGQE